MPERLSSESTLAGEPSAVESLILATAILTSSLVWTGIAIRKLRSGQVLPTAGTVDRVPLAATVIAAGWVGLSLLAQLQPATEATLTVRDVRSSVIFSGILAVVLAGIYSLGNKTTPQNQLPVLRAVNIGLLGSLASALPVLMVQMSLQKLLPQNKSSHALLELLSHDRSPETVLWIGAAAVVTAPLLEELLYRVILQGALRDVVGRTKAVVIVAGTFSLAHGWPNMLGLLPLALILGYIYDRTNSYLAVVTTHAAFNTGMLLLSTVTSPG